MSQEDLAHQASFGLPPPAPREKQFGEDEFSEDVNSTLTTEEPITELKQGNVENLRLEEQNRGLLSTLTTLFHLFFF
jgi:hypothetical protein